MSPISAACGSYGAHPDVVITSPAYFQEVKISAVALIKMVKSRPIHLLPYPELELTHPSHTSLKVIHARSGGQYEIMGLMIGKIKDRSFIVMDSFALPVQGTETRVNAGDAAMEYMVNFKEGNEEIGKNELVVGWYHR